MVGETSVLGKLSLHGGTLPTGVAEGDDERALAGVFGQEDVVIDSSRLHQLAALTPPKKGTLRGCLHQHATTETPLSHKPPIKNKKRRSNIFKAEKKGAAKKIRVFSKTERSKNQIETKSNQHRAGGVGDFLFLFVCVLPLRVVRVFFCAG